ncbi:MAG: DUF2029 domain-containing protein [Acidobacteria bacterium]|nr:DUF2029 domain-containing protein [Acidobacteriota bacterium]
MDIAPSLNQRSSWSHWKWILTGCALVALHIGLGWLSRSFVDGRHWPEKPILILVGVELISGALYWFVVRGLPDAIANERWLAWACVVGVMMRAAMFISAPMIVDDYYRYLWDGAVTAHGVNPYTYAPSQALAGGDNSGAVPLILNRLAKESGSVASRINHPSVRSIYPPTAQAAFVLAHWISPWSLRAWRLVVLLLDAVTFGLILVLLRELGLPLLWAVIYWWNPLFVKEIINSGHMDVVVLPFALGSVLLTLRRRHEWALVSLVMAIGAKVWPIVLLPLVVRPLLDNPKRLLAALGLFGLLLGILLFPMYSAGLNESHGLIAYGRSWEMNDALFMLLVWMAKIALSVSGQPPGYAQPVVRLLAATVIAAWTILLARQKSIDPKDFCERNLLIIAAVFLLSPAQFPWYYVWLLPWLAIRPRPSLLLLTALLPLYYLRFYFYAHNNVAISDYGIVWLEYVPVWSLLIREWYVGRVRHTNLPSGVIA